MQGNSLIPLLQLPLQYLAMILERVEVRRGALEIVDFLVADCLAVVDVVEVGVGWAVCEGVVGIHFFFFPLVLC